MKYIINAFNYPYKWVEAQKQTSWIIVAIIYFIIFSIKYDGVDVAKRGD